MCVCPRRCSTAVVLLPAPFFSPFRLGSLTSRRGNTAGHGVRDRPDRQRGGRTCSRDGPRGILSSPTLGSEDARDLYLPPARSPRRRAQLRASEVGTTLSIAPDKGDGDGGGGDSAGTTTGFFPSCGGLAHHGRHTRRGLMRKISTSVDNNIRI